MCGSVESEKKVQFTWKNTFYFRPPPTLHVFQELQGHKFLSSCLFFFLLLIFVFPSNNNLRMNEDETLELHNYLFVLFVYLFNFSKRPQAGWILIIEHTNGPLSFDVYQHAWLAEKKGSLPQVPRTTNKALVSSCLSFNLLHFLAQIEQKHKENKIWTSIFLAQNMWLQLGNFFWEEYQPE